MPLYDYVNEKDSKDILEDQFYQSSENAPEVIEKDKKKYRKAPSLGGFRVKGFSYANGYS